MINKKIIIVGAGPGGLASGMILSHKGYDVTIYEKESHVGGRTSPINIGEYTFDLGPTFVMLPHLFEDIFTLAGKKLSDYIDWKRLDTLYTLHFDDDRKFPVYFDKDKLKIEIDKLFPGESKNYDKYLKTENKKYEKTYRCLTVPYMKWYHYFRARLLKALPYMDLDKSLYQVLSKYFKSEDLKISMTFQAKYLGMSPWNCPGTFSMLSYIEHKFGIYHPLGGVHKITEAMAKVVEENNGRIILNKPIKEIIVENNKAVGVRFLDKTEDRADKIIINADFAYSMTNLLSNVKRNKWNDKKIEKSQYSCSTFMIYLALDKKYEDLDHHNVFFAKDYRENVKQIFEDKILPIDPSFYIQNASKTDNTLAPDNKSTLYILVPVPNLDSNIDWDIEKDRYMELVLNKIMSKTNMKDIKEHIVYEKIITPKNFKDDKNVYRGAVFNLAHNIKQMLYLRPHNKFEDIENIFLVGGGTHPGSGLPTILESGRIVADLIDNNR